MASGNGFIRTRFNNYSEITNNSKSVTIIHMSLEDVEKFWKKYGKEQKYDVDGYIDGDLIEITFIPSEKGNRINTMDSKRGSYYIDVDREKVRLGANKDARALTPRDDIVMSALTVEERNGHLAVVNTDETRQRPTRKRRARSAPLPESGLQPSMTLVEAIALAKTELSKNTGISPEAIEITIRT